MLINQTLWYNFHCFFAVVCGVSGTALTHLELETIGLSGDEKSLVEIDQCLTSSTKHNIHIYSENITFCNPKVNVMVLPSLSTIFASTLRTSHSATPRFFPHYQFAQSPQLIFHSFPRCQNCPVTHQLK